jgi:hypothetical protein
MGCITHLGEDSSRVGTLRRDCVVPVPGGIRELGAPTSLEFPDESLWLWAAVTLEDGREVRNVSARVASAADVCNHGPTLARDDAGEPLSFLALTAEEMLSNEARVDGRKLALLPQGGFVHDGVGFVFYEHTLVGPGIFESTLLGTGLCEFESDGICRRVVVDDSSLLFPAESRPLNEGGLVLDDRALIFGCRNFAQFSRPCTVASVELSSIRDPSAYSYYNAFEGWVADPLQASIVLDQLGALSVSAMQGQYLATTLDPFAARFDVRFASEPTGSFERPIPLFDAVAPDTFFVGGGREHSGLRGTSRVLNVSYFTNRAGKSYGLHLASFELNAGLQ